MELRERENRRDGGGDGKGKGKGKGRGVLREKQTSLSILTLALIPST